MISNSKKYNQLVQNFGILIHGGAGRKTTKKSSKREIEITRSLEQSASSSFDFLKKSSRHNNDNTAVLDAVEIAIATMEDSGLFDAGVYGSDVTVDGEIEMDASIMNGKDLSAGSVGMVKDIQNPIKLARLVMDYTDHVMLVSDGVIKLAKLFDIEIKYRKPTQQNLTKYNNYLKNKNRIIKKEWPKNHKLLFSSPSYCSSSNFRSCHYGTVGAVAIDRDGNIASGVSTGGRWFKMHGRIGDSAIIGSGLYADNELGAACATGVGELIMRLCLAKTACDYMTKDDAIKSSKKAIKLLTKKFGKNTGGIITVDKYGQFGMETNTHSMPIAVFTNTTGKVKVALSKDKAHALLFSNL
jgi:beta-aspartyl-peptidase (threonine type)